MLHIFKKDSEFSAVVWVLKEMVWKIDFRVAQRIILSPGEKVKSLTSLLIITSNIATSRLFLLRLAIRNCEYGKGIKAKESAYAKMGFDVVPVYPYMFAKNWKKYLINKIEDRVEKQYRKISSIPFHGSLPRRQYNFWE